MQSLPSLYAQNFVLLSSASNQLLMFIPVFNGKNPPLRLSPSSLLLCSLLFSSILYAVAKMIFLLKSDHIFQWFKNPLTTSNCYLDKTQTLQQAPSPGPACLASLVPPCPSITLTFFKDNLHHKAIFSDRLFPPLLHDPHSSGVSFNIFFLNRAFADLLRPH